VTKQDERRDFFAAAALTGLAASLRHSGSIVGESLARAAWDLADMMIAAETKPNPRRDGPESADHGVGALRTTQDKPEASDASQSDSEAI